MSGAHRAIRIDDEGSALDWLTRQVMAAENRRLTLHVTNGEAVLELEKVRSKQEKSWTWMQLEGVSFPRSHAEASATCTAHPTRWPGQSSSPSPRGG